MTSLAASFTLDNSGFLAKMLENGTVTEREAKRMQKALDYVSTQLRTVEKASAAVAKQTTSMKELGAATETASHFHAGFTRELLVLTHELSQGNYKKFGGSLLVLAEYSGSATRALSSLLGPLGAVVGGVGLLALAVVQGAHESENLRQALVKTGNYAGITQGQFNALAKEIAGSTTGSIGHARDAIEALISTGQIGPKVLAPLSKAVVLYAKATGETEAAVADDFAKMSDGVAKWANEHNKSLNFITAAQYDYIKRLEEQGQKEQAELVVAQALSDHFKGTLKPNLGYLESAIKSATEAWTGFWDAAKGLGRAETVDDQIEKQIKLIDAIAKARPVQPALGSSGLPKFDQSAAMTDAIRDLQTLGLIKQREETDALSKATQDRYQKAGIAASDYFTKIDEERKGTTRLTKDLEELQAKIKARVEAGGPASIPEDAQREAFLRHRDRSFTDKAGENDSKALATYLKERETLYAETTAKLTEQASELERYGKILDKTAVAIALVDVTTGKAAKATFSQKAELLTRAALEDEAAEKVKRTAEAIKEKNAAEKQAEANGKALSKLLNDQAIATDIQVEALKEDVRYLGLNTVERKIAIEQLKIERDLRKELADPRNAGHEAEIQAGADSRKSKITDALTEADAAQQSFGFGAQRVFKQYQLDAANAAKFSENVIGGGLTRVEDALVKFAQTGKLSFKDLFAFMADEYLRQTIRMQIASATSKGGFFEGIGSALTSAAGFLGFGHKDGLDYVPYDGYPAILHKGERVQTAAQASAGNQGSNVHSMKGHTVNVTVNQSFAAGTDRRSFQQAAAEARTQLQMAGRNL